MSSDSEPESDSEQTDAGRVGARVRGRRPVLQSLATGIGLSVGATTRAVGAGGGVTYTAGYRIRDQEAARNPDPNNRPELVRVRETVTEEKWTRVKSAHAAARGVLRRLQKRFDLPLTTAGVSTRDGTKEVVVFRGVYDSVDRSKIPVSIDRLREAAPSRASGTVQVNGSTKRRSFPVRVAEWPMSKQDDFYDCKYRPVPGSARLSADWSGGKQSGIGTLTQPVYNENANAYQLLTAGHVIDQTDIELYQSDLVSGSYIGGKGVLENNAELLNKDLNGDGSDDETALTKIDAGTVDIIDDVNTTYQFGGDNCGYTDDINGYWSFDKIQMKEDSGSKINHQGIRTGVNAGEIFYTDSTNGFACAKVSTKDGDSGGPYFVPTSEGAEMIGVHTAGVDLNDDEYTADDAGAFNSIEQVLSELPLSFL